MPYIECLCISVIFNYHPCDKVCLGEMGCQFLQRFQEHRRGQNNRNTNPLYMRHFVEEECRFVDLLDNYKIIKKIYEKQKQSERNLKC